MYSYCHWGAFSTIKKDNSSEPIAKILVKEDCPNITDTGTYLRYIIYKDGFHKYRYVLEKSRVTFAGLSDPEITEEGKIKSREDLDDIFNKIYESEYIPETNTSEEENSNGKKRL